MLNKTKLIFLPLKMVKSIKQPFPLFKSVPLSLCKYNTIMTNTRTIYFSYYQFIYNIQVKICFKNVPKEMHIVTKQWCIFAAKWFKIYIVFTDFTSFLSKSAIFTTFTAFANLHNDFCFKPFWAKLNSRISCSCIIQNRLVYLIKNYQIKHSSVSNYIQDKVINNWQKENMKNNL